MKRAIAITGLFALACQVALGSAGSLLLCLCAGDFDFNSSCQPPAAQEKDSCCEHESAALETEAVHAGEPCQDLFLESQNIDLLDRAVEGLSLKAPATQLTGHFSEKGRWSLTRQSIFAHDAKAAPGPRHAAYLYSHTIQLLL